MRLLQHVALLTGMLLSNACFADNGEALFASRCMSCHKAGPTAFKSTPATAQKILSSGSIRQHRFSLSSAEIEAVTAYIAKAKG